MSGGGNKGAWETGVLWGLMNYGNPVDYEWDVVIGVSAGSINAFGVSGFAPEDGVEMTDFMSGLWHDLHTSDIWVPRPDIETALWTESSLLDSEPLFNYLDSIAQTFPEGFKRRIAVNAADVATGDYHQFTNLNTPLDEFYNAAGGSSSIPVIFPPHHYNGNWYMDGGVIENASVSSAVNQCLDFVDDYSDIIIDVLICGQYLQDEHTVSPHAWENWLTVRSETSYYNNLDHLEEQKKGYPDVDYRMYFGMGHTGCSGFSELNFEGDVTWCY